MHDKKLERKNDKKSKKKYTIAVSIVGDQRSHMEEEFFVADSYNMNL